MNKHTQGPWRLVEDRMNGSLQVYGKTLALFECWRRDDAQTEIANTRLVAAAPELLEALQRLIATGLDEHTYNQIMSNPNHYANAAIAKATGGEW